MMMLDTATSGALMGGLRIILSLKIPKEVAGPGRDIFLLRAGEIVGVITVKDSLRKVLCVFEMVSKDGAQQDVELQK